MGSRPAAAALARFPWVGYYKVRGRGSSLLRRGGERGVEVTGKRGRWGGGQWTWETPLVWLVVKYLVGGVITSAKMKCL